MKRRSLVMLVALIQIAAGGVMADPYPGAGIFTAGDLWDSFLPSSVGKTYYETAGNPNALYHIVRVGNFERQWTTPTQMYPAGSDQHIPWKQDIVMVEYSPDDTFNFFTTSADPVAKHYAYAFHTDKLAGVATRDDGAHWVNPDKRDLMIYNASFPTNLGVSVTMRVRQYSLNYGNFNDFIAIEFELTNTGVQDLNGDGTPEKTNNRINALTLAIRHELINSMTNSLDGRRGGAGWFTGPIDGYDDSPVLENTPDQGWPWGVPVVFTGPSMADMATKLTTPEGVEIPWAPDGKRTVGITMNARRTYQDIYTGAMWIAAKQGSMDAGHTAPDKTTIFDSHAIGEGPERGWYVSVTKGFGNNDHFPWEDHTNAMGTFYANANRTWDRTKVDRSPDPGYFDATAPGTVPGNPLTFVPKPAGQRGRPQGDQKLKGWVQNWEVGSAIPAVDRWVAGGSMNHGFDGDQYVGIGPFSLDPGETITLVLVEYGGYRLKGVRRALRAARYAYENDWQVPTPPAAPRVKVEPSVDVKVNVKWDNHAESSPGFAGYKIYRVTAFPKFKSDELGTRFLDRYHEQTVPNMSDKDLVAQFTEPVNPNLNVSPGLRDQDPGPWGPWKLIANIRKDQLSQYKNPDPDASQFQYVFKDGSDLVTFGFTYWYYVAAYDNQSGEIPGLGRYTSLESHKTANWNGKSGIWEGTYHFATASSFFPKDLTGLQRIGANFVLKAPLAKADDLRKGALKVRVKPNPYKRQALHDLGLEHKILFFNLPTGTRITIFDVSGQIVDVLEFGGTNPNDGTLFWDMFSKDGSEVQSGLYIYVAEYPGGKQKGYLSILK
jgi:hypothetical protein